MKSRIIRILFYGILVWLVSASYGYYQSSINGGGGDYNLPNDNNFVTAALEKFTPGEVNLKAKAALVMDAETGEIIYAKNRDLQLPVASLTKLATALVVQKSNPDFTGEITITKADVTAANRTKLYWGETISLDDCLYLTLMCSDNAAARALARSTGMSNEDFLAAMNDLADELGMKSTCYTDPTGLDAGNISTATDYIKLINKAYQNPEISKISATKSYQFKALNKNITHTLYNTNRLLNSHWNIKGGKTGYISQAGYCLALDICDDTGRRINAVLLGAPSNRYRYRDADQLLAYATRN